MTLTPMFDPFFGSPSPTTPARNGFLIVPTDNKLLPAYTRAIWVGTAGNLTVYLRGDPINGMSPITKAASGPVTFMNVPAGTKLEICASCVMATGTTAGALVGLV
jgi:hypothetical protein